jgi:hypothetical protein
MRVKQTNKNGGMGSAITLAASACLVALMGFAPSARAQCEVAKLFGVGGVDGDDFGRSCGVSGDVIVVGDPSEEDSQGAAYVYGRDGAEWIQEVRLTASDGRPQDIFGSSAAISGNVIVIGAYYWFEHPYWNQGAAYVFRYDGQNWIEEAFLQNSDSNENDIFGWSVAIDGDVIVVGARDKEVDGINQAGAAYVFRYDGQDWIEEDKLVSSDPQYMGLFGVSVSVAGDVAVVGAHGVDSQTGAAYVFRHDSGQWSQEAKLTAFDGSAGDWYGEAVGVSDDASAIVVGSRQDDGQTGSAYVYRYNGSTWPHEAKLVAQNPEGPFPFFGRSVAINADGSIAVIGAVSDYAMGAESGAGYVFRHDGAAWDLGVKVTAWDGQAQDRFGTSTATDGDIAVFGATGSPIFGGDGIGAAYVFAGLIVEPDCNGNGVADMCDIIECHGSFWCGDCNENGIPDECDIADGTSLDRDDNGLPDECDPDCNENGVPDICDIDCSVGTCASHPLGCGGSYDCHADNVPDECQLGGEGDQECGLCIYDDGSSENSLGLIDGGEICWIQHCTGEGWIGYICTCFGTPRYPGNPGVSAGDTFRVYLWDDPNGDGNPNDAVFLAEGTGIVDAGSIDSDVMQRAEIGPVYVGESYFIGASAVHLSGSFPAPMDEHWPQNEAWVGYVDGGTYDPQYPGGELAEPINMSSTDWPCNWLIAAGRVAHADCNDNGIPDECDVPPLCDPDQPGFPEECSADINGNGVPDECECLGDFNYDGQRNLGDLGILLSHYNQSGMTYEQGDFNGDGTVDLADLGGLLAVYEVPCP